MHAAIAALWGLWSGFDRRAPEPPLRPPIDVEIVPPAPPSPPAPALSPRLTPAPAPRPTPAPAPRPTPAPTAPAPDRLAITGYDHPATSPELGGDTGNGTGLGGGDTSDGGGLGGGRGLGLGTGAGALPSLPAPPPPPPPPEIAEKPPSKARPPKLIYPKRDRDGDESETFVARLTVDTDGYVVGARLLRGIGGPRDELASQLVWRFRSAPALDADGRAIRATIEQRFLVGH